MVKFNDEVCNDLCKYREEGLTINDCADLVGINRNTVTRWVEKGKNAKSGKYKEFYIRWQRANAKFKRLHHNYIADSKSWLAHQYLLQVTDPEQYVVAEKQEMEANINADTTLSGEVDLTSPEFMDKELELMKHLIRSKDDNE